MQALIKMYEAEQNFFNSLVIAEPDFDDIGEPEDLIDYTQENKEAVKRFGAVTADQREAVFFLVRNNLTNHKDAIEFVQSF